MSLSKAKIDEMAEVICEEILKDKELQEIARLEQDDIDAILFPIIQNLEDMVDDKVSEAIASAFKKCSAKKDGYWWQ